VLDVLAIVGILEPPAHSATNILLAVVLTFVFVAVHAIVWIKVLERRSKRKRGPGPDHLWR
jgi:hypothetical protein